MDKKIFLVLVTAVSVIPALAQEQLPTSKNILAEQHSIIDSSIDSIQAMQIDNNQIAKITGSISTASIPSTALSTKPTQKLGDVKKIFVASFGTDEGAEIIRQKVFNRLLNSGILTSVESPAEADAILKGAASVVGRNSFSTNGLGVSGRTNYTATLVVHLTGKDNQTLWCYECRPALLGALSCSSNVSDKMIKYLVKAIEIDKNKCSESKTN